MLAKNNNDDNDNNDKDIKYCDGQAAPQYPDSCYDSKDLPKDSGYDDDEKTANCGGESCTDTEKEESSGDEESASDEGGDTGGD
jgi:hypothetical protein